MVIKLFIKILFLLLISYLIFLPSYLAKDPVTQIYSMIFSFFIIPVVLLIVGKFILKIELITLVVISLLLTFVPLGTVYLYEEYQQYLKFNQSFTNESFQNQFFSPDIRYNRITIKKISYQKHHVVLQMNYAKLEGETEKHFLYDISNFVEEYTPYKDLYYLTVHVNYEGNEYTFSKIPLKKQGEPYKDVNESLQAVKNSLAK